MDATASCSSHFGYDAVRCPKPRDCKRTTRTAGVARLAECDEELLAELACIKHLCHEKRAIKVPTCRVSFVSFRCRIPRASRLSATALLPVPCSQSDVCQSRKPSRGVVECARPTPWRVSRPVMIREVRVSVVAVPTNSVLLTGVRFARGWGSVELGRARHETLATQQHVRLCGAHGGEEGALPSAGP